MMKGPFSHIDTEQARYASFWERMQHTFSVFFGNHQITHSYSNDRDFQSGLSDLTLLPLLDLGLRYFIPREHTGPDSTGAGEMMTSGINFFKWLFSPLWVPLLLVTTLTRTLLSVALTILSSPIVAIVHFSIGADTALQQTRTTEALDRTDQRIMDAQQQIIDDMKFVDAAVESHELKLEYAALIRGKPSEHWRPIVLALEALISTKRNRITDEDFNLLLERSDYVALRQQLISAFFQRNHLLSDAEITDILRPTSGPAQPPFHHGSPLNGSDKLPSALPEVRTSQDNRSRSWNF